MDKTPEKPKSKWEQISQQERRTLVKAIAVFIFVPFISQVRLNETLPILESNIAHLIYLFLLLRGLYLLVLKQPRGWLWLAGFFYPLAFTHIGITSWLYLGLTLATCTAYLKWKYALGS